MDGQADRNSGKRKKQGGFFRKTSVIMLCLIFFICAIYLTDVSTKKMMLCKDDKRAIGVYSIGADILRLDLAGEHYMLDYKEVRKMTGKLVKESERAVKNIVVKIKN